jgi:hypothetical protein
LVCITAPILTYLFSTIWIKQISNYEIGNELIIINAFVTMLGLLLVQKKKNRASVLS